MAKSAGQVLKGGKDEGVMRPLRELLLVELVRLRPKPPSVLK